MSQNAHFGVPAAEQQPVSASELYIVTDQDDKELMLMPLQAILRQGLYCRVVLLALLDNQGKLLLQRRPPGRLPNAGQWDIYSTPVMAGEGLEDAAYRLLHTEAGIVTDLKLHCKLEGQTVAEQAFHVTLFSARLPKGYAYLLSQQPNTLLLDRDELEGLLGGEPGLFTGALAWAHENGLLFNA